MEGKQEDLSTDNNIRQRKFGLPDWMVNNIERLNFSTDFEQYACSPPESEGFLADYKESHEFSLVEENSSLTQHSSLNNMAEVAVKSVKKSPKPVINPVDRLLPLHTTLTNIKSEELFSSPDSTPCATPEPSPVVRRKMSNPTDTVITNPGRWFYIGKMNKLQEKVNESDLKNKSNLKAEQFSSKHMKPRDPILNSKKNGIKLMISNFDLNAVSPTSW